MEMNALLKLVRVLPVRVILALLVFSAAVLLRPTPSSAQGISLIRDAEIENTIRAYAAPLFRAAGLQAADIRIFLVRDDTLNAFVADGQKMFLNTGLLMRSADANQVIGVIAHETGHISGGHLARVRGAINRSAAATFLSYLLGTAAILGGRGDVASVIFAGGQGLGTSAFLRFSRTQESAADQAALRLLDATRQSSEGLTSFLRVLGGQELLSVDRQNPYMRTHPLSRERISLLERHLAASPFRGAPEKPEFAESHRRMVAKLKGFLQPRNVVLRRYKESDTSLESRYARAIAYYRQPDLKKALPLIDGLIAERPRDAYFHELRGQMLYENGRPAEALVSYQKAVELMPHSPLMRTELAQVQLDLKDPALLKAAIINLQVSLQMDKRSPLTWRRLAIAYGRTGQMGQSTLALAEEALLKGDKEAARYHAGKAERTLPRGSIGWLKAQDIMAATQE